MSLQDICGVELVWRAGVVSTLEMEGMPPSPLTYHPDSPYYGKSGYYGFLTPQQEDDLVTLESWINEKTIDLTDLSLNSLNPKLTLLRYLRANKFNVDQTKAHILRNLEWRTEMDVKGICSKTPEEILGCKLEDILAVFPHWQSGSDEFGRPMIYKQYGSSFDASKILKLSPKDSIANYHIWEQEACMRLCYETSLRTGYIVETVTCFIDIGGLSLSQVTRDFLAIIKLIAEIDQSQYPETLGRTFILNASSLFPMVWRMVRPWLDPVVANKMQILAGVESWHPYLLEHVGAEFLSSSYGGEAEYLDASVHPYAAIVYCESGNDLDQFPEDLYGTIGTITRRMLLEGVSHLSNKKRKDHLVRKSFESQESKSSRLEAFVSYQLDNQNEMISLGSQDDIETGNLSPSPPSTLKYALDSPYYDRQGYLGCLSEDEAEALETLQNWIIDEGVDLSDLALNSLHPRLTLLRYLRANKFSVEKAIEKIQSNIKWRIEMKVKDLINLRPSEILGCEMSDLVEFFPHWQSGNDKHGRPVLYKQYNNHFDATKILKLSSTEAITKYHIWEQEACMRLCFEQSKKTGHIVETLTAVVDVKGMQLYQVTRDFLGIVKAIADIDQNHYPETLGQTFIINTPTVFPFVWRGVKPWLDPVVASKIQIFGQNESEWQSALFEAIGQSNMPATYGGELAPLDSKLHPYQSILGPLPSGTDGKGLSIGDRMKLDGQPHATPRKKSTLLGLVSSYDASENSSICSSAFDDALDGDGDAHIPVEYRGWDNEIQYLRSMVNDLNSQTNSVSYGYGFQSVSQGNGDDDSETNFEDCLTYNEGEAGIELDPIYEDVRRTLSSSILYSFYQAMKRGRSRLVSFYKMLLPKFLLKLPKNKLSKYLNYSVLASMVISVTCIGLSGYALSDVYWTTSNSLVRFQMWSSVVILCLASIYTLLNFAGFVGSKTSNRPLLILFNCSLTVFFIIFLIISMICFACSTNNSSITGIRNEAINQVDNQQNENVDTILRRYNLTLGTVSVVLSLISLIPLTLSTCYCEVLDRELREDERNKLNRYSLDRRLYEQTQQLSLVVRIAHVVAIIISLPMIGYGASSLHYLLKIQFNYSLFAIYCLMYGGITSLLASAIGIWSSVTASSQLSLLKVYLYFVMPIHILVLFGTGLKNVLLFPHVSREVNSAYDHEQLNLDYDNNSKVTVSILLQIQLLVGGVLSLTAACFQLVCLFCVVSYYLRFQQIQIISTKRWNEKLKSYQMLRDSGKMTEEEYQALIRDHAPGPPPLTPQDKIILVWSVLIGLIHIYVGGTFAVFAYRVVDSDDNPWMVSIWKHLGKYDSRYVTADGFLISTKGLLALFGGPLFLIYAWSIITRHKLRLIIGILVNSLEMYTQIIYFMMEIQTNFASMSVSGPVVFTIGFILNDFVRTVLPPWVIWQEVKIATNRQQQQQLSLSSSKDHPLLLESSKSQSPTNDKGSNSLETGDLNWARYMSLRNRRL